MSNIKFLNWDQLANCQVLGFCKFHIKCNTILNKYKIKYKHGFIVSEVIFFWFYFQAGKWRTARSSRALQRCLVPFAYPDFNHASTIAQRYVTKICIFKWVCRWSAFIVVNRMVNHSWSTVYSKIMFLPYLQKVALNRSFRSELTGLSVFPVFLPYQSAIH